MTRLEEMALQTLQSGIRWRLGDEPCWCPCERRQAWKAGTKLHIQFCREASELYSELLDECVADPPLAMSAKRN